MNETILWFVVLACLLALVVYAVFIYNNLVRLKHLMAKAWSNIDVLLKQRHDELPKLVGVCKQYMLHEQQTLERVTQARTATEQARQEGDVKEVGRAETQMRLGLGKLFAVAEAYPDLKANQIFLQLQARISGLEDAIADRREFYNDSVNINNIRIEQFPDVLVARKFGFAAGKLLQFEAHEISDVNMQAMFA